MPTTCHLSRSVEAIAMGYGDVRVNSTASIGNLSRQLMFAELITMPSHVCREMLPFIFSDSIICAANELRKQSIFMGDSGGPLVMANNHTLIGISSTVHIGKQNWVFFSRSLTLKKTDFSLIKNRKRRNWRTPSLSKCLFILSVDKRGYELRITRLFSYKKKCFWNTWPLELKFWISFSISKNK